MVDKEDDDLFESVTAMADRIGLTGREKTKYVHDHMTRGGYRAVPSYVRADDDDEDSDDEGSPFFGGRRRRPTRDQESGGHGSGTRRRRGGGDDEDWYS